MFDSQAKKPSNGKVSAKKIGIGGHPPTDHPEFARFLVKQVIDSVSLNLDSVLRAVIDVAVT